MSNHCSNCCNCDCHKTKENDSLVKVPFNEGNFYKALCQTLESGGILYIPTVGSVCDEFVRTHRETTNSEFYTLSSIFCREAMNFLKDSKIMILIKPQSEGYPHRVYPRYIPNKV